MLLLNSEQKLENRTKRHTELSLGGLDDGVGLTSGDRVTLRVQLEVMDQGLHVLLHVCAARGRDLEIVDTDGTSRHVVDALVNDAERLTHLLHTAKVTVIAVSLGADGDIKVNEVIGIVGLDLAQIPVNTGSTQH